MTSARIPSRTLAELTAVALSLASTLAFADASADRSADRSADASINAPAGASADTASDTSQRDAANALVKRGEYLVTTSGCHDCHTPLKAGPHGPERDQSRMLSGHPETLVMPPLSVAPALPWEIVASTTATAWHGPWGVSFTANLTPDPETGLGRWTLQNFKDTIRTGRHLGRGREILPPMPIPMYRNFNDQDLEAIFAFLQSIPAVSNRVPEPLSPPATPAAQ